MTLSNLTPYTPIPNSSRATTGLFNYRMNTLQQNIDTVNASTTSVIGLGFFNVQTYGAVGDGVTDDTVSIQSAINAANPGLVWFPPTATGYLISSALVVDHACAINGGGVFPLYGSGSQGVEALATPLASPYIKGSVVVQNSTNTDGFIFTGAGISVRVANVGVRFASRFTKSGHGFNVSPPTLSGKPDSGLMEFSFDRTAVYGHDGDHYAYNFINCELGACIDMRSWGGGHLWLETNSAVTGGANYGNLTFVNSYGMVLAKGSANGIQIKSTANNTNLLLFLRPQIWVRNVTILASVVSAPTSAQYTFHCGASGEQAPYTTLINPDLETNVSAPCILPTNSSTNAYTSLGLIEGANSEFATYMPATSSSAGAKIWDTTTQRHWDFYTGSGPVDSLYIPNTMGSNSVAPLATAIAGQQSGQYHSAATTAIPSQFTGLIAWYVADDLAAGSTHGASVQTWADRSTSTNTMLQSLTTRRPSYLTNQRNGLPTVRFGTNSVMEALFTTVPQPFTVIFIATAQQDSSQPANSTLFSDESNAVSFYNNPNQGFAMSAGTNLNGTAANYDANWHIYGLVYNGSTSTYRVDGASSVTGNVGTNSLTNGLTLSGKTTTGWNGDIGEFMVYNRALSDSNISTIEHGYMIPRWSPTSVSVTITGTGLRGVVGFGGGTTPTPGEVVEVSLSSFGATFKEAIAITSQNSATQALGLFVRPPATAGSTKFVVSSTNTLTASSATTTYQFNYIVMT